MWRLLKIDPNRTQLDGSGTHHLNLMAFHQASGFEVV